MYCVALEDLDRGDVARAGGKAANLGALLRAGVRVPGGFCVTTEAYDDSAKPAPRAEPEHASLGAQGPGA